MAWTTPRTWVAAETVTAALLNTHVRDNLNAVGGAWTAYTPTITGWALGNGTVSGWYLNPGKTLYFRAKITAGTTTTFGSTLAFSLPGGFTVSSNVTSILGQALLFDSSASANLFGTCRLVSGAAQVVYNNSAATNITGASGANPWTWATSDMVEVTGMCELA